MLGNRSLVLQGSIMATNSSMNVVDEQDQLVNRAFVSTEPTKRVKVQGYSKGSKLV